jgi:flagellar protein FliO/FliZ
MSLVSQTPSGSLGTSTESLMSLALLGKTALALGLVLGCVFLCGWLARRVGARPLAPGKVMRVVSSTSLGQREKVVIIEVQGKWLVLGVTAQQVNTLSELQAPAPDPESPDVLTGSGFAERLASALKRNMQRGSKQPENRL